MTCDPLSFRGMCSGTVHEPFNKPRLLFTLDGEIVDEAPIHFTVVPGAIRMHVGSQCVVERNSQELR